MSPEEARRAARIELGGIEQVREQVREARAGAWIGALAQDVRYGVRMLKRNPGFTVITILTLALGIGANTALFSVLYALLLRGLPYKDSTSLIYVSEFWPHEDLIRRVPSRDFANWRAHGRLFDRLEGYGGGADLNLTGAGEPERLSGVAVTSGFLDLIGVHPAIGRNFTREEDVADGPRAVLLGHTLWQRRFGSSPGVMGRSIELDGRGYTVVGVLPESFLFPDNDYRADLLIPMALPPNPGWASRLLKVMARLKPGATAAAMRDEFLSLARAEAAQTPPQFVNTRKDMQVTVTPLRERLTGDVRRILLALQAAVAMLLMIGCLNVANLQISRSISRQKEMALRAALGAGRGRLLRQLLTESFLLSGAGGAAGLALGYWGLHALLPLMPANLHLFRTVRIEPAVLAFTLAIAALTGIVTGLAPLLAASKSGLAGVLKENDGKTTSADGRHRLRGVLVVAEVAVAMTLLAGSGLLIRSFQRLAAVPPGFDPHGALTLRFSLSGRKYPKPESHAAFHTQLLDRARTIPGVQSAAIAGNVPLTDSGRVFAVISIEGVPVDVTVEMTPVSTEYFQAVRTPILRGRVFTAEDGANSPKIAIVNQAFADRFFPGQDAIGKRLHIAANWRKIVGIAGNVRPSGLRGEHVPEFYLPASQSAILQRETVLILRTELPPATLTSAAIAAVHAIDPDQPVFDVATMEQRIATSLSTQRSNAILMGVFAALALILSTVGIFGVIAYFVSRRSHEIGIRMALGARPADVLTMVLRHGMSLATIGIALGIGGALVATRGLQTLLYDVKPGDPTTLAAVSILFAAVAALACYVPARWAAKVDPMVVLRHD